MMTPEEYKREIYKELIDLIGKEKAEKYMQKKYFSPTAIGLTIFFERAKKFAKNNPKMCIIILGIMLLILAVIIKYYLFY